jgi:transcriptional regulator with XRE-family HTH domain
MTNEREEFREELQDHEARHDYADMFLDSSIALQVKALRLQRKWKQRELASRADLHQSQISDMEQISHSGWTIETLKKVARAFDLTLRVRFESFGTFLDEYVEQNREGFERPSFDQDPAFAVVEASSEQLHEAASISDGVRENQKPTMRGGPAQKTEIELGGKLLPFRESNLTVTGSGSRRRSYG